MLLLCGASVSPVGGMGFRGERNPSRQTAVDRGAAAQSGLPRGGARPKSHFLLTSSAGCQLVASAGHHGTSLWLCSCMRPTGGAGKGNLNPRRKAWEVGLVRPRPTLFRGHFSSDPRARFWTRLCYSEFLFLATFHRVPCLLPPPPPPQAPSCPWKAPARLETVTWEALKEVSGAHRAWQTEVSLPLSSLSSAHFKIISLSSRARLLFLTLRLTWKEFVSLTAAVRGANRRWSDPGARAAGSHGAEAGMSAASAHGDEAGLRLVGQDINAPNQSSIEMLFCDDIVCVC